MLAGQPARVVYFDESAYNPAGGQYIGQLPTDLDGSTLPPAGSPNLFAEIDDASTIPPTDGGDGFVLRLWKFHVDWANPSNSTFGDNGQPSYKLPVAPYVRPQCVYGYGDCAPQKGGPQSLDILGDRLMFRIELSELRQLRVGALEPHGQGRRPLGHPLVRAPHPEGRRSLDLPAGDLRAHRQRDEPDLALDGQHRPGQERRHRRRLQRLRANDYPSVRYTGRAAGDPLGQMTQAEQVAYTGTGPQTEAEGRWGDYSDLTVDPRMTAPSGTRRSTSARTRS